MRVICCEVVRDSRPDLYATFIRVAVAYYLHFLLVELDDAFLLQLFYGLYDTYTFSDQNVHVKDDF